VILVVLAGCTLFQSDIPDTSCTSDDDCFRAQGEVCDMATKECVLAETPDAPPMFDAPPADAPPADAPPADAAVDATVSP
jgi:hypothetical protein